VAGYSVVGRSTHDARLVATMKLQGITHILTFNVGDFTRYKGIVVVDPATVS
jgi:predicted nucleic acid-binding protein